MGIRRTAVTISTYASIVKKLKLPVRVRVPQSIKTTATTIRQSTQRIATSVYDLLHTIFLVLILPLIVESTEHTIRGLEMIVTAVPVDDALHSKRNDDGPALMMENSVPVKEEKATEVAVVAVVRVDDLNYVPKNDVDIIVHTFERKIKE